MIPVVARRLVLVTLAAATVAASPRPRQTGGPADRAVPFHVGELLTYDVSWSGTLSAGTATLAVKERRVVPPNRGAYDLVAEAKPGLILQATHPVYYALETLMDTRTLLPIQASMYSDESGHVKQKTTKFVSPTKIEFEMTTGTERRGKVDMAATPSVHDTKTVGPNTLDCLAMIYMLRALMAQLTSHPAVTIPFTDGTDNYRLELQVTPAPERIKTGLGTLPARRFNSRIFDAAGKLVTNRRLTLWMSDDARALPLRFDVSLGFGSAVLTLTKAS